MHVLQSVYKVHILFIGYTDKNNKANLIRVMMCSVQYFEFFTLIGFFLFYFF